MDNNEDRAVSLPRFRRPFSMVLLIALGLVGGMALLLSQLQMSGAVVTNGQLVADTNAKKVQHPTGGVVAQLKVKNGDIVNAGDLLIRLDDTIARATLNLHRKGLDELAVREARLVAERDDQEKV